jgi:hypothetical protein
MNKFLSFMTTTGKAYRVDGRFVSESQLLMVRTGLLGRESGAFPYLICVCMSQSQIL